jgi:hypothetical protein
MIVRISTEGQYRLESAHLDHLNGIDNRVVDAVARGDAEAFGGLFGEMLAFIRANGQRVAEEEIATSDVILPPPDTTLAEARGLFAGEGALPG